MRPHLGFLQATIKILLAPAAFGQTSIPANIILTQSFNPIGTSATVSLPANGKIPLDGKGAAVWLDGSSVAATTQAATGGTPSVGDHCNWATSAGIHSAIGIRTHTGYTG